MQRCQPQPPPQRQQQPIKVLGDKDHGKDQRTKQFNDGHVPDLVEVGAGPIGQDIVNETKVFADLKKNLKKGCKSRDGSGSGTIRHDGHRYGFGNSEDDAHILLYATVCL